MAAAAGGPVAASANLPRVGAADGKDGIRVIHGEEAGAGQTAPKHGVISILDTKTAEANKQKYTEYILQYEAADSKEDIAVAKRFAELHDFHDTLSRRYSCLPPFPPKTLFRSTEPDFVERRKQQILNYLRLLLMRNDVAHSKAIEKFLGIDTALSAGAGAGGAAAQARPSAAKPAAAVPLSTGDQPVSAAAGAAIAAAAAGKPAPPPLPPVPKAQPKPVAGSSAAGQLPPEHGDGVAPSAAERESTNPFDADVNGTKKEGDGVATAASAKANAKEKEKTAEDEHAQLAALPAVKKDDLFVDHGSAAESSPFDAFTPHNPFTPVAAAAAAAAASSNPFDPPAGPHRPSPKTPAPTPASSLAGPAAPIAAALAEPRTSTSSVGVGSMSDVKAQPAAAAAAAAAKPKPALPPVPVAAPKRDVSDDQVAAAAAMAAAGGAGELKEVKGDGAQSSILITDRSRPSVIANPQALWSHTLELTMKLPVFAITKARVLEQSTIVCSAGNMSAITQLEVYFDNLFSRASDSAKKSTPPPLGGVYAFRRNAEGVYRKTLNMLFARIVNDFEWDEKRRWLYLVTDEGELHVYNPSAEFDYAVKILTTALYADKVAATACAYASPTLFTVSDSDRQLTAYDVEAQRIASKYTHKSSKIAHLCYDARHSRVFVATFEGGLHIFKYSNSQFAPVHTLKGHNGSVRCLAYCDATQTLASGSFDTTIALWALGEAGLEAGNAKLAHTLRGHAHRIKCINFSHDGKFLVSGDSQGHVALWDLTQLCCILAFKAHNDGVTSVELTHDYQLLTSSTDLSAKFWQLGE